MRYALLLLCLAVLPCADVTEYDVGAKWDVEYRVQYDQAADATTVVFNNRRERAVSLGFTLHRGIGDSGEDLQAAIVIPARGSASYPVKDRQFKRPGVDLDRFVEGIITANGFVAERPGEWGTYVGANVYTALQGLGLGYDANWIRNNIQTRTYFTGGIGSDAMEQVTARVLIIPTKAQHNGKPIWTLDIHLDGDVIASITQRFEYFP